MDWLMTISPTLLYVGCVALAGLLLVEYRCVRELMATTRRLRAVFPEVRRLVAPAPQRSPLALPLGSPLPDFRAAALCGATGDIDRSVVVGQAALLIFVRPSDFEWWPMPVAAGMETALRERTGARAYMILASGESVAQASLQLPALVNGGMVVAAARTDSLWIALGIEHTPCVIELDSAGVLQRVGLINPPVAAESVNGGGHA